MFLVEPQPRFAAANSRAEAHYGGEFFQRLAWTEDGLVRRLTEPQEEEDHIYVSMFTGSAAHEQREDAQTAETLDVARWMKETFRPDDELVMNMGIEGAEFVSFVRS